MERSLLSTGGPISYEAMTKVDLMLIPLMCHVYVTFILNVIEIL